MEATAVCHAERLCCGFHEHEQTWMLRGHAPTHGSQGIPVDILQHVLVSSQPSFGVLANGWCSNHAQGVYEAQGCTGRHTWKRGHDDMEGLLLAAIFACRMHMWSQKLSLLAVQRLARAQRQCFRYHALQGRDTQLSPQ